MADDEDISAPNMNGESAGGGDGGGGGADQINMAATALLKLVRKC